MPSGRTARGYLASDLLMLDDPDRPGSEVIPARNSLGYSADEANGLAADLADDFRQSGIPVEVMRPDESQIRASVEFRYETDRGAANSVARMMPGPFVEPSFVRPDPDADRPPRPGQIEVTFSTRQYRGSSACRTCGDLSAGHLSADPVEIELVHDRCAVG